jgi:hypothetical protein
VTIQQAKPKISFFTKKFDFFFDSSYLKFFHFFSLKTPKRGGRIRLRLLFFYSIGPLPFLRLYG